MRPASGVLGRPTSVASVKTHVNSILTKLGARNRVEVAAFAFRTGRVR